MTRDYSKFFLKVFKMCIHGHNLHLDGLLFVHVDVDGCNAHVV